MWTTLKLSAEIEREWKNIEIESERVSWDRKTEGERKRERARLSLFVSLCVKER